jgi:hypothetical protein
MVTAVRRKAAIRRRALGRLGGAVLLVGLSGLSGLLSGCASTFGELPAAIGGLPEGTPERSATPVAYPAVHDMPPQRNSTVLTADEQKKATADLAAARAAQEKRAAAAARDQ